MSTAAVELRASAGRLRQEADRLEAIADRLWRPIEKPPMTRPDYERYGWHITEAQHGLALAAVELLVVHHDGSAKGDVDNAAIDIHRYHVRPEKEGGKGFAGIGYGWWLPKSGVIEVGRGEGYIGAHADYKDPRTGVILCQYNRRSLSLCLAGHYGVNTAGPPPDQWAAAVWLCAWLKTICPRNPGIFGHGELPGWEKLTACPGIGINMVRLRYDVDSLLKAA